MQSRIEFSLGLTATMLFILMFTGCSQNKLFQSRDARNVDCRSCHITGGASDTENFSVIYTDAKRHHSVGVQYPLSSSSDSDFSLPNGQVAGIKFFDRNGNGKPDENEIQLFGSDGEFKVECSSCHMLHGETQSHDNDAVDASYLRINNAKSGLCVTCHNN